MEVCMNRTPLMGEGFDVIVIGAGHGGCEAALASARMGEKTALLTLNLDSIGMMPCNPSIGGTGKGHLVRELDAMGGEMGLAADDTLIQMRMLNTGKGPAVHSLRAQMDKRRYHERMKRALEAEQNLTIIQSEAVDLATEEGRISGVVTAEGFCYPCRAAVLCTGVYLQSRILIGEFSRDSGPNGMLRSEGLSANLCRLGVPLRRFKTGTPPRIKGSTMDLAKMAIQLGDDPTPAFSFLHGFLQVDQAPCYLTYTNTDTHDIILNNLHRSPLYAGRIHATGTRYCPSIEDKVVKFRDKDRHQLFMEPEGLSTKEVYVQGLSTSLPADVQEQMLHTIQGLERAQIMRYGYAIEYDCLDPQCLDLRFMVKALPGLFSGGQINGSSGYEEAAAQGFYAGVNAALYVQEEAPFILGRDEGYLGVLVDDLVTKGTPEPYRMMTSRCEYRLLLRQDNADLRLTEKARRLGLISKERLEKLHRKQEKVATAREKLQKHVPADEKLAAYLTEIGETVPRDGARLFELLKRPAVTYTGLLHLYAGDLEPLDPETAEQIDVLTRYDGYLEKERREVERMHSLEDLPLPQGFDYGSLTGLRLEARQKLTALQPQNVGQASRISGVSPADVSVLLVAQKRGML